MALQVGAPFSMFRKGWGGGEGKTKSTASKFESSGIEQSKKTLLKKMKTSSVIWTQAI